MWSTRARLAAAYAGLLFATLATFSGAVYFARRASAYQDLGRRAVRSADQVLAQLASAERSGKRLTSRDSVGGRVSVSPLTELRNTLEPLPGYFLVLDPTFSNHVIPASPVASPIRVGRDAGRGAVLRSPGTPNR